MRGPRGEGPVWGRWATGTRLGIEGVELPALALAVVISGVGVSVGLPPLRGLARRAVGAQDARRVEPAVVPPLRHGGVA